MWSYEIFLLNGKTIVVTEDQIEDCLKSVNRKLWSLLKRWPLFLRRCKLQEGVLTGNVQKYQWVQYSGMLVIAKSSLKFGSYEAANTSHKGPYIPGLISPCIVVVIHIKWRYCGYIWFTFLVWNIICHQSCQRWACKNYKWIQETQTILLTGDRGIETEKRS